MIQNDTDLIPELNQEWGLGQDLVRDGIPMRALEHRRLRRLLPIFCRCTVQ